MSGDKVRIGVAGTSWWADSMYLPALANHPLADVRAIVGGGRRGAHARVRGALGRPARLRLARRDARRARPLDAVMILAPNIHHHPYTMAALERGLHVLCEKPLGMTSAQAREMTETAERLGVVEHVPVHVLVHARTRGTRRSSWTAGYIGRPYHLNMRYFADYGRDGVVHLAVRPGRGRARASPGTSARTGSYIATWLFGEVAAVTAVFGRVVPRAARPDGAPFEAAEDSAMILLEFENGATGSLHVSSVAYEPSRVRAAATPGSSTAPRARST